MGIEFQKVALESRIAKLRGRVGRENTAIVNKLLRRLKKLG